MISLPKKHIIHTLFLELLSLTPIIIILGNVVPPFPIKIHFIGMGIIFLCSLYLLMDSRYKLTVLVLSSILVVTQFVLNFWDIKNIIDFLFGPFVLVIMFDFLINNRVPKTLILKYQKRFYILMWVPLIIGLLQYFDILPITIWNANYVNYSYSGGVQTPRPNGFLYHGSELSIIIFFAALFQFFNSKKLRSLTIFILILGIAYTTYFKAILTGVLGLFFIFLLVNTKPLTKLFNRISDRIIILLFSGAGLLIIGGLTYLLYQTHQKTGYLFNPQLMTGRGSIWNIYTDGFKDYSVLNYLFGGGIGSGPELFKTYASVNNWYPLRAGQPLKDAYDAHNALLSLFVNGGIFSLAALGVLYVTVLNSVNTWQKGVRKNKYLYIAFTILALITIGITIPLFDMAIIWPCLGFLLFKWKIATENEVVKPA